MRKTTNLNLSQFLSPDTQISISVRTTVGNTSNKDSCVGLSCFICNCSALVRRCVLSDDAKNQREHFLLSARPHPMFLVKSRGIVTFSEIYGVFVNDAKKCVCVLMKNVCTKCSEIHMTVFLGGMLCTSAYGCILVYIGVQDCRKIWVTWGGIFGLCLQPRCLQLSGYSCLYK